MPRLLPDPTPEQRKVLASVREATDQRADWEAKYIDRIVTAHELGCTAVQIAEYTNTSYQSVQKIVKRHSD